MEEPTWSTSRGGTAYLSSCRIIDVSFSLKIKFSALFPLTRMIIIMWQSMRNINSQIKLRSTYVYRKFPPLCHSISIVTSTPSGYTHVSCNNKSHCVALAQRDQDMPIYPIRYRVFERRIRQHRQTRSKSRMAVEMLLPETDKNSQGSATLCQKCQLLN